jgi:hypothetical protein
LSRERQKKSRKEGKNRETEEEPRPRYSLAHLLFARHPSSEKGMAKKL